jgi:hypothetical protein
LFRQDQHLTLRTNGATNQWDRNDCLTLAKNKDTKRNGSTTRPASLRPGRKITASVAWTRSQHSLDKQSISPTIHTSGTTVGAKDFSPLHQLLYKAERYETRLVAADRWYPAVVRECAKGRQSP